MKRKIRRKEIYLANSGKTVGSEENGIRPVLIIQNNLGNKYSPTTIILPFTKRIEQSGILPTHIQVETFGNIEYKSTILAEQIKVLDKSRLICYIETLPNKYMKKVDEALKIAVGLNKETG